MIRYLIDADCAVYAMTAQFEPLRHRLEQFEPGVIGLSTITFAEIFLGSKQGKPPPVKVLDAFLLQIPLLGFDEAAARAYADMPFKRARFDRLLAAHALSIGATVITNNEGDFADVPGLNVENWTK